MRATTWLPLVALSVALAQGPMGPGGVRHFGAPGALAPTPGFADLKAYLNLTDSQIQSIQQAQQKAMESQRAVVEQIQSKQQALHDLLDKGASDAATVGKLMLEIQAFQKQLEQARTATRSQLLGFLTADQKTKLAALEQAAKLWPLIHQGAMLGLLEPPALGPGFLGGPGAMGPMRPRGRMRSPEALGPMGQRSGAGVVVPRRPARVML